MTEIVRASLGLPPLRAGPQFQNFNSVLVIEYWNLRFNCNLVLGIWDLGLFDVLNDFYDFNDLQFTVHRLLLTV